VPDLDAVVLVEVAGHLVFDELAQVPLRGGGWRIILQQLPRKKAACTFWAVWAVVMLRARGGGAGLKGRTLTKRVVVSAVNRW